MCSLPESRITEIGAHKIKLLLTRSQCSVGTKYLKLWPTSGQHNMTCYNTNSHIKMYD